ncbi:MAG: chorismate synthase [Bacteroidales bacterium]|nr:chorismate synthase [Bacteroidales bacterium]
MNSWGNNFKISIFGESHGEALGVVVDGVRPGLPLDAEQMLPDLTRRRAGGQGTTARREPDTPQIVSGLFRGRTTGAPLAVMFRNVDAQASDYERFIDTPRPSHVDFVASRKYHGYNDFRGGGHLSGRLTLPLVAAGVVAKLHIAPVVVRARLLSVGGSPNVEQQVAQAQAQSDSVGGLVECEATGLPVGVGEPLFGSVESAIAALAFAIPGVRGVEFGAGFAAAAMRGSQHNDPIVSPDGRTSSNHAGGVVGGITNGNALIFRVAVKPTASIGGEQRTLNMMTGQLEPLQIGGRHDACIALRVPVVLEAVAAIALADLMLAHRMHNV